jgi:hypothetical protein
MNTSKPKDILRNLDAADTSITTNAELDAQVFALDARQGERVLKEVYAFLGRFVSYPSEHARVAHTLWVTHCHLMDVWDSTPRLAFLSAEPASGKTRALEITELLVPNPVPTVNVSPAYLFRKVGSEDGATILYDEIDTVFGPRAKDNEDIRGLLNAGHRRGATTGRCVMRGNEVCLEELPAYSAVALAGIGWLPDTILSRSVIIRMRRRHAGEKVEPFRRRIHENDGWRIRDLIAAWAKSVSRNMSWPDLPPTIVDRDADIWEPLIAVADAAGGDWSDRARVAAVALVADSKEAEPSLGVKLLNDLRAVFGTANEMSSKSILQALHGIDEAPWGDIKGKPLDERGLSHRLRQYGLRSKTIRTEGNTPKGYTRADLVDVWTRYLSSPAMSATSATSATTLPAGSEPASHCQQRAEKKLNQFNPVADVADVADFGRQRLICAHCRTASGELCEASVGGRPVWLHATCVKGYWESIR